MRKVHRKLSKVCLLLLLTVSLGVGVQSQPRRIPRLPITWGVLADEDRAISSVDKFPDCGAVVVFDIGLAIMERFSLEIDRHIRIKLLDQSGVEMFRNIVLRYDTLDDLKKLQAQIVSSDQSTVELPSSAFVEHNQGDFIEVVIPFKDAKVGDFIEYSYTISYHAPIAHEGPDRFLMYNRAIDYQYLMERGDWKSFHWDGFQKNHVSRIPDWCFYHAVPTLRAELSIFLGTDITYAFVPYHIEESLAIPPIDDVADHQFEKFTWQLKNISPVVASSGSVDCCLEGPSLVFRFVGWSNNKIIALQGIGSTEWKSLGGAFELYLHQYIKRSKKITKQIKSLRSKSNAPMELAKEIFEFVCLDIKVDNVLYDMRPACDNSKELNKVKKGSIFERNILLFQMLREAGFDVKPMLIATSDKSGILQTGRFNHMICCLTIDEDDYFLDTSELSGFGDLPEISRISEGLLINGNESRLKRVLTK